jgi:murein DD-endopeptidase MepM/ murein hydrolase activator NlpD
MIFDKKDKHFTIIILSDAKSKVKKFSISFNLFRFIFVFLVIIFASATLLVFNLIITHQKLENKIAEIERMEYKINYKEIEFANLKEKTDEIKAKTVILESYLEEVKDLDKMVRDITGKGGYEEEVVIYNTDLNANVEFESDPNEMFYYGFAYEEGLDDINALLDDLLSKAPELSEKLSQDKQHMEDHIYLMEHTPSMWPTWGMITSLFGERRGSHIHQGLDIANRTGTPVNTTASGVVLFAGWHGGFGNKVIVYHGFDYTTVYAHLSKIYVSVGDEVSQGDVIGTVGSTGYSTGPHLHYEVIVNGVHKNPMDFLP